MKFKAGDLVICLVDFSCYDCNKLHKHETSLLEVTDVLRTNYTGIVKAVDVVTQHNTAMWTHTLQLLKNA